MKAKICFLIDDDDDDREIFETALYNVDKQLCCITAASSTDALRRLARQENFTPDYIFIDLHMPCVDGKQCLAEIKKLERLTGIPVIVYSTSMAIKDIEDTRRLGATAYISKHWNMKQLEKSLQLFFSDYPENQKSYEY